MNRAQRVWIGLRASLWFVPALVIGASLAAAVGLVALEPRVEPGPDTFWAYLLKGGPESARSMLSAIATSTMTVAGVVFSVTMVVLTLASSQFSPRILRSFMRDRITQSVLGVFLGVFVYCLVVMHSVRGPGGEEFVPSVAVVGAVVYAVAAVCLLVYFIHHMADSVQAASILEEIELETQDAIDAQFPKDPPPAHQPPPLPTQWTALPAVHAGYVLGVDAEPLLHFVVAADRVARLPKTGAFVVAGAPLLELSGPQPLTPDEQKRLRAWVSLGRQRTVEQDPAFGFQQLVDMAVKALSPGINDPTTACMCVDQLSALLVRVATREPPAQCRWHEGVLRLVTPATELGELVRLSFAAIIRHSSKNIEVLHRVLDALTVIRGQPPDARRCQSLIEPARAVMRELRQLDQSTEVVELRRRAAQVALGVRRVANGKG
ncbi:MAG: DUF2254 domain-containing protein [Hydrogenophaga sp.]|nr:DUF2254 domain-containing protein [Hydrogenophaga sp.]